MVEVEQDLPELMPFLETVAQVGHQLLRETKLDTLVEQPTQVLDRATAWLARVAAVPGAALL
jgi:hypothetical protein